MGLGRVIEQDPAIIDAHQMLGQIASIDDRFEDAVGHFQRALQLDDSHKSSLFGLASAYLNLGRKEEAMLGYERLLEISSRDTKAALPLSDLYEEAGRIDDDAIVLEEAAGQPEATAFLLNRLGELRALQQRNDDATVLFERAIAANADFPGPYLNLAVLSEEAGDIAAAVRFCEMNIERAPRNFQAQFNLDRIYGQMGRIERQQAMWEAAIESKPEFARGHY